MISIIVAVAENGVIGKDNSLIWHLPVDMKFFKDTTLGHCVIMGRKNYESIPEKFRPFSNRTNIVVTRQKEFHAPGTIVVDSIEKAIEAAKQTNDSEIFIIGGAEIYKQTLPLTGRIYLTRIHHSFDGDTFFPEINLNEWKEVDRKKGIVDEKNIYPHDFIVYDKIYS